MKRHQLKCQPEAFAPVLAGQKTSDYRADDSLGYFVGDVLILLEWRPAAGRGVYTGREVEVEVTHIVRGPASGIPADYVMMSIRRIK